MRERRRLTDEQLDRLLAAPRAEADPLLMTRVRARLATRPALPAWLAWSARPQALAASVATLVLAATLALLWMPRSVTVTNDSATLADALDSAVGAHDSWSLGEDAAGTTTHDTGGSL